MPPVEITEADLSRPEHQQAIEYLIDQYARDPMGGGTPLPDAVRRELVPGLRAHPTTVVFLAYSEGEPVGIAVCFRGFSTFAARPLINVHDLAVLPTHRRQGIGTSLLQAVESKARATGCCKVTLEVLEQNQRARRVYEALGFVRPGYGAIGGETHYLWKPL